MKYLAQSSCFNDKSKSDHNLLGDFNYIHVKIRKNLLTDDVG